MTPVVPLILAQHGSGTAQSGLEFSRSMARHAMATSHSSGEVVLVVLGALIVLVTTLYTVLYLIRPGEKGQDHIKRRILDEGYRGL
jgi:hypothetical protein